MQGQNRAPNRANPLVQATLLGEALEAAPIAAVLFDEDRNYLAANAYACELTGYTRAELLDVLVDFGPEFDRMIAAPRLSGRATVTHKDGRAVPVEYLAMTTDIGGIPFFLGFFWPEG